MYRVIILAAMLWAGVAAAEARVALLSFKGPKAAEVRKQLAERLCQEATCVKPGRNGDDVSVDGVVTAQITRAGKGLSIELKVFTSEESTPVKVRMPIAASGKLSQAALASMVASVHGAVGDGSD